MPIPTTMVHELQPPARPSDFPLVDNESTLTDFPSLQQQLINKPNVNKNNASSESIIRVEKTTTTHNFYDVEKLGDEIARNSFIHSSNSAPTAVRPLGMGNPGIIGKYILVTQCTSIHFFIKTQNQK
jgi:hypothetical protein